MIGYCTEVRSVAVWVQNGGPGIRVCSQDHVAEQEPEPLRGASLGKGPNSKLWFLLNEYCSCTTIKSKTCLEPWGTMYLYILNHISRFAEMSLHS